MRVGLQIQDDALRTEVDFYFRKAGYDIQYYVGESAMINIIEDDDHHKTIECLNRQDVCNSIVILRKNDDDLLVSYGKRNVSYCVFLPIDYDILFNRIFDILKTFEGQEIAAQRSVDYQEIISDILMDLGVTANLKGYRYLLEAVNLIAKDINKVKGITKNLYPMLGKKYHTRPQNIERNIRHAIEAAWDKGRMETINRVFGNTVSQSKGKPTNSEFIARIADFTINRYQMKQEEALRKMLGEEILEEGQTDESIENKETIEKPEEKPAEKPKERKERYYLDTIKWKE